MNRQQIELLRTSLESLRKEIILVNKAVFELATEMAVLDQRSKDQVLSMPLTLAMTYQRAFLKDIKLEVNIDISRRAWGALRRAEIFNVPNPKNPEFPFISLSEVCKKTIAELLRYNGLGRHSLNEIIDICKRVERDERP